MAGNRYDPTLLDEGLGALAIAATMVTSPISRSWYGNWGAAESEINKSLPGDEQVPAPVLEGTRAITIQAPASEIWPWLLQLGHGRGGFYSYQRLENLAGCDIHNADRIVPEYQRLNIGDKIGLGPEGFPAFEVAAIDPEHALILRGDLPGSNGIPTIWLWTFYLDPIDGNSTRLLLRTRQVYERKMGNTLMWRIFTDPISFNMERKMLKGIKARVEATGSD